MVSPPARTIERRRSPRIEVLGRVGGKLLPIEAPLKLLEIGRGGFSAETSMAFTPGSLAAFRFSTVDGPVVELAALVVHCRFVADADHPARYISGFEFTSARGPSHRAERLLDALRAALVES